ncbi:dihydroxy-acid dehydratase [Streptomyces sp. TRM68367]|uniref:dihydroxy-acid dehydratase n=1 Tax=Streptomyces sp. TRM68367 TaxID=2758415 RepID=UPI00165CC297|nr:dihydroxy-acid dehydratase [Streptomyces sp. TRM68367]MBC9726580.1 dihydroxy-acid dehydratase [Streptomyces sp. TRM68367]
MSQRGVSRGGGAAFRDPGQDGMLHRAFLRGTGLSAEDVRRSPVIGIATSASDLNPCNLGTTALVERIKEGVRSAGGLPLAFPTISVSEPFTRPTSLYLRNLLSMDVEEMITGSPVDGVVLVGGCDKTVPAQIMGALSAGKPAAVLTAGPRMPTSFGRHENFTIDDIWPVCEARRVGEVSDEEWVQLERCAIGGVGTCNVMGTAITMAAVAEVLGFSLPGSSLPPATSDVREELAFRTGEAIVAATRAGQVPGELVSMKSLENAFRVVSALGGSTNAVIHLEAIAGRAGHVLGMRRFSEWSATTPHVADVRPSGQYSLAALETAGGVPAVLNRIRDLVHLDTVTVTGRTWKEHLDSRDFPSHPAIAGSVPLAPRGGLVVLHGNLAPCGAVLKVAGVHDERLQRHRGRAVVFEGLADLNARIDDPDLPADADSVLVLRGMGVIGAPGMPEVGHIPVPAKLRRAGVRDMLRISDARMSGTATGTVVLHVTPEAAVGGPLGLVREGDEIELDVAAGTIRVVLSPEELARRCSATPPPQPPRGYAWLHHQHALQADQGCDFDFLRPDFRARADAAG